MSPGIKTLFTAFIMSYSLCFPVGKGKAHNIGRQKNNECPDNNMNSLREITFGWSFLLPGIE